MRYQARLTKEQDQTVIDFPDCPGCNTFADAGEDVLGTAREALEGWLEAQISAGRVPPEARGHRASGGGELLDVYLPPALAARVQLRQARERLALSQGQLAERVGVSRQAISQLESPDANLRLSTLEKVAEVLGLAIDLAFRPISVVPAPALKPKPARKPAPKTGTRTGAPKKRPAAAVTR